MKINNFFINKPILEKEKLNKKPKINFSNFLENDEENEVEHINRTGLVIQTKYNQEIEITEYESKQAYHLSKQVIEKLDEIRDNLASGNIDLDELKNICRSINYLQKKNLNQKILTIIEDIELRVEVEIAKIEQSLKLNT